MLDHSVQEGRDDVMMVISPKSASNIARTYIIFYPYVLFTSSSATQPNLLFVCNKHAAGVLRTEQPCCLYASNYCL